MSQINSKNTKYDLADALVELTDTTPFKDISISSVAFTANMHRNTVYYHFNDMRELCFFTIHNELSKALNTETYGDEKSPDDSGTYDWQITRNRTRDALAFFFTRFKSLLDFTRKEVGVDSFLSRMRIEILPALEPFVQGEFVNSDERKRAGVDIFAQQILVAYLVQPRPDNMIKLVFDNIMPELLNHEFL